MKASKTLWLKRLAIAAAAAALPQVLLAHGADTRPPPPRPDHIAPDAPLPPPGMLPGLPLLHGVDLNEAQQDAVFELVHAHIPAQRTLEKKAAKALAELQRLSSDEQFNVKQARAAADAYAQAQAQLAFTRAELDAKLRAVLTPEQRQQIGATRAAQPGPRPPQP